MAALSHSRAGSVNPPRVMEFDSKDAALAYRRLMEAEGWETVIERRGWGKWLVKLSNSPKLIGGNPAVSGKQYRLAQAVLGGANVESMPKSVAREIVNRTPKHLRSQYAKHNPEAESAAMYESFHGTPSSQVVEIEEQEHYHENLAELGVCCGVVVETVMGNVVAVGLSGYEWKGKGKDAGFVYTGEEKRAENPDAWLKMTDGLSKAQADALANKLKTQDRKLRVLGSTGNYSAVEVRQTFERPGGKEYGVFVKMREENPKTKLDLILDTITPSHEVTFDVRDYTADQKRRIEETAKARGLHVSGDGKHILVRYGISSNPLKSPWTVSRAAREAYAAGYAGKHQFADWVKLKRLDDRSSGFLSLIKQDYLRGLEDEHHDAQGKRATGRTRGVGSHEGYEIVRTEGGEYVAPKWDADSRFESLHLVKAAIDAHPNPGGETITLDDGRVFPVYEGKALTWDPGSYNTHSEEQKGYPKMRAVIAAMRVHRPEQLEKLRRELVKDSFGKMFGHNAAKMLKVVEENPKRGPIGGILHDSRSALFGAAGAVDRELGKAIGNPPQDVHREVVAAARDLARKGLHGEPGDKLPNLMSGDAVRWINDNLAAFRHIVSTERIIHSKRKSNPHDDVEPETTLLCSNEDGTQLYLVGGDQCLDLEGLGITGDMATKEEIVIGCVQQCWYSSQKSFDKFQQIDYFHNFSEDSKNPLPELVYNRVNEQLSLVGGSYHINQPLMGVSPGIED